MDLNRTFFLRKEDRAPKWQVIDASGKILGRLATEIAGRLMGKTTPKYTPFTDAGEYVVVINVQNIEVSAEHKLDTKTYEFYSGWIGGRKEVSLKDMMAKHPDRVLELAVRRMLPKNKLAKQMLRKLKIYSGSEHPHRAQV